MMNLSAERLKQARLAYGNGRLRTTADAARHLKVDPVTYTQHENGTRGFTRRAADYAKRLGVSLDWLLGNSDDMYGGALTASPSADALEEEAALARQFADNAVRLAELSVLVMKLDDPDLQKQVIAAVEAVLINAGVLPGPKTARPKPSKPRD